MQTAAHLARAASRGMRRGRLSLRRALRERCSPWHCSPLLTAAQQACWATLVMLYRLLQPFSGRQKQQGTPQLSVISGLSCYASSQR